MNLFGIILGTMTMIEPSMLNALAPPPINFGVLDLRITNDFIDGEERLDMKTVSRGRKILEIGDYEIIVRPKEEQKPKIPSPLQQWLQDEFMNLGWWPFVFMVLIAFPSGICFLMNGDAIGASLAFVSVFIIFGLMVYAFRQR